MMINMMAFFQKVYLYLQVAPGFNVNNEDYINNFLNTIKSAQDGN